ncbi:hypothetical protein G4D61_11150 [Bacillus ginsengihumi]|uniref:Uncharacterized protein n=1 Tax=Heyndrickxia ginsengihumi TaxID=363870 RepID=A0A6M0P735_9BACI|nr:hypothetical protein [Heyndrickxia ginsengihumi]NEY20512.1 hypothetical protein [Heyndrickxia ginsengihumi]
MNIEEAKQQIKEIENYINLVETYEPKTFEEDAIKTYVLIESVNKAAVELNEKGYRVGNRKVCGKDITNIILSKPKDDLHKIAQQMFKSNRRKSVLRI